MAKRAPADEAAYNPLDEKLVQTVITPNVLPRPAGDELTHRDGNAGQVARDTAATGLRGFTRAKRVLLTPEEERDIEMLVVRIAEQIGASLKLSHLLRAGMAVFCHAEGEILRHAAAMKPLARPTNGNAVALAQFEQAIARMLSLALRDAPPMR